jgi:cytochrome c
MTRPGVVLACLAVLAPTSAIAADATAGQAIFNRCRICHSLQPGGPNTVGPNLHGVFGRKAGSVGNFAYSEAMKSSGIVWDDDTIRKYVTNPKDFIPGNKMAFPGIKDENEVSDLLAYLRQAAQ